MAMIASDFMLLLVTINPFAVVPVFLSVTEGMSDAERRRTALRASVVATVILLSLLAFGQLFLEKIGVTLPALRVAGGLILLLLGTRMVFGDVPGAKVADGTSGDIAVFPLAMPMLAGGGSIAAVVAMTDHHVNSMGDQAITALVLLAVMAIIYLTLRSSKAIHTAIGATGTNVMSRIMGLVLTALAVQTFFSVLGPALGPAVYP